MPTGIETSIPTATKLHPTALRALLSSFAAISNPTPVPMMNRVLFIIPISGSVNGISRMKASHDFRDRLGLWHSGATPRERQKEPSRVY